MFLLLLELFRRLTGLEIESGEFDALRLVLAGITALFTTIFFGKKFIKKLYEWKIGDRVRLEDCPLLGQLHQNKNNTPTMGGILILFSLLVSLILWMDLASPFTLILFSTLLSMGLLGAYDDYLKLRRKNTKGLSARGKFALQILFSALVSLYLLKPHISRADPLEAEMSYAMHLYVPFLKSPFILHGALGILLMLIFSTFVITGASNAVNLTDGLDGLASGCMIFAASAFAFIAFISSDLKLADYFEMPHIVGAFEVAIFLAAVACSAIGFLWYNGYPAQVFMGDTGSLALGGILGVSSVLLKQELLLGIIGGVFVLEALSVILQVGSYKLRGKKRIFLCAPLHHHFEYKGWSEPKVVMRFWIAGLLFAILGMTTLVV